MNSYTHACLDARRYGGVPEDYILIHDWFDESKKFMSNYRHRALRHHTEGIYMCESIFGSTIKLTGVDKRVAVRLIGESHVIEDLGFIPSVEDWFMNIQSQKWMMRGREAREAVSRNNKLAIDARKDSHV
jgi:hypothetical protein